MPTTRLILASASPARRNLLRQVGIEASVLPSAVDEDALIADLRSRFGDLAPEDLVMGLARAKAEDVASGRDALVLGCDSMLELDGEVHGKPADAAEATDRWRRMRGKAGTLHTGHWLIDDRDDGSGGLVGATASTRVHFADLTDAEIAAYVATGEPLRVAGAFTVDGLGGAFVTGIEGDHHNVVGLSLPLLRDLLGELGIAWYDLAPQGTSANRGQSNQHT
ncbi:MAG TPA: nucleoside triphosphate pyrophosphatase [Tetrasphaera sp.]|nr:nucleoside triphosphate pyrophosphatase [Tetrasphaera sp.]